MTDDLWAATLLMMGVRYTEEQIRGLSERVQRMRESVTYQMIINEGIERGRAEGARQVLLGLGARKLGPADSRTLDLLQRIADVDTLELMAEAVLTSTTWDEVLEAASR